MKTQHFQGFSEHPGAETILPPKRENPAYAPGVFTIDQRTRASSRDGEQHDRQDAYSLSRSAAEASNIRAWQLALPRKLPEGLKARNIFEERTQRTISIGNTIFPRLQE